MNLIGSVQVDQFTNFWSVHQFLTDFWAGQFFEVNQIDGVTSSWSNRSCPFFLTLIFSHILILKWFSICVYLVLIILHSNLKSFPIKNYFSFLLWCSLDYAKEIYTSLTYCQDILQTPSHLGKNCFLAYATTLDVFVHVWCGLLKPHVINYLCCNEKIFFSVFHFCFNLSFYL